MKSIPSLFVASASLALLAACGGGGGSSGTTPAPVTTVAITSSNQSSIARATIDGGIAMTQAQGLQTRDRATAQSVTRTSLPSHIGAVDTAIQRALQGLFTQRRTIASATARPAATSSDTSACSVSGSVTTTIDDHDNSGSLSNGDTLTVALTQCKDTADDSISGTMVFTVSSVASATSTRIEFSGSLAFQQVNVVIGQTSAGISGSVGLYALETSSNLQVALTVNAGGLAVTAASPGYADSIVYDAGMQISTNETTTVPSNVTGTLDGSFTATSIGGRVTIATVTPISQSSTDPYPATGQVVVTGASGSKLRITVINTAQIQLELDADGDGIYAAPTVATWASLLPA
jgi:hypothetical protein